MLILTADDSAFTRKLKEATYLLTCIDVASPTPTLQVSKIRILTIKAL